MGRVSKVAEDWQQTGYCHGGKLQEDWHGRIQCYPRSDPMLSEINLLQWLTEFHIPFLSCSKKRERTKEESVPYVIFEKISDFFEGCCRWALAASAWNARLWPLQSWYSRVLVTVQARGLSGPGGLGNRRSPPDFFDFSNPFLSSLQYWYVLIYHIYRLKYGQVSSTFSKMLLGIWCSYFHSFSSNFLKFISDFFEDVKNPALLQPVPKKRRHRLSWRMHNDMHCGGLLLL